MLAGVAALVVLLAGCVGGADAPKAAVVQPPAGFVAAAAGDSGALEVGIVHGTVADEELVPLPNVTIAIVKLEVELRTGSAGEYEITHVPVGNHTILANRIVYEQQVRSVQVLAGEVSVVDFRLKALVLAVPFVETFPHVAFHHLGNAEVDHYVHTLVNNTCESCRWVVRPFAPPQALLIEATGRHAVTNPTGPDAEYLYLFDNKRGDMLSFGNHRLPVRLEFPKEALKGGQEFRIQAYCDLYWICYEERRDFWVSAFHEQDIPKDYTAVPK